MTDLQLDLFEITEPEREVKATIAEKFAAFHALNGWVYDALETLMTDWVAAGHRRASVDMFMHVIRWQYGRATTGAEGFKVNNNFGSHYARMLVDRHPEWAEAIETRALRAA